MGLIYRTKLNVTKEQLADQRAYLQQLKTVEADREVIEREKTVEKHLRKKEVHNFKSCIRFAYEFLTFIIMHWHIL